MTRTNPYSRVSILCAALALALLLVPTTARAGAKITIVNGDGAGEGFNDPTPAAPVGGNPGTTLGQQRLIAFQYAADLWGATLDSNTEIFVFARFDPLGTNVLGSAGPTMAFSNFPGFVGSHPGAEFADIWYVSALADKRAGTDLAQVVGQPAGVPDITARFSSNFNFYLGLDNNHGPLNDLVVVVLHELGHGMGFLTLTDRASGAYILGDPDIFTKYTLDGTEDTLWPDFATNAERAASAINVDNVAWDGGAAKAAVSEVLSVGRPELTFDAPASLGPPARVGTASFGPVLTASGLSGTVVLGMDAVGPATDACEPLSNAADIAGNIALVDRGTCTFTTKVANAQAAGAIAVLVADNVLDNPPPGLGGVDPAIAIPSVRIALPTGNAIKAELAATTVQVTLGLNMARRAGALVSGEPQLYATNPIIGGSSISHWDSIAFRNLLMEPAVNPDLHHQLIPPYDLTLVHFRDMGWYLDADLDGIEDSSVIIGSCDTGRANALLANGATLADQARRWYFECSGEKNVGQITKCFGALANEAKKDGLISGSQRSALLTCANETAGTQ